MPTRKIDFQSWLETIDCCRSRQREPKSNLRLKESGYGMVSGIGFSVPARDPSHHLDERLRVGPLTPLVEVADGLVHDDRAILAGDLDLGALEGARRRALEVDPRHVIARAVARALELVLGLQPVGG